MSHVAMEAGSSLADRPQIRNLRSKIGSWLAPRPFTLVSTIVYAALLVLGATGDCDACQGQGWEPWAIGGAFAGLLALDRLDYFLFGDMPPARAGLLFLAGRVVLIEVIALVSSTWLAMWPYAMLPYIASLYFGMRGAYWVGAYVGVNIGARYTWQAIAEWLTSRETFPDTSFEWSQYLGNVVPYSILLVFVVVAAKIVIEEKASRKQAERLLTELESSHRQLRMRSEEALKATQERNRLAREIHDSLGHYLTVVNVQLEKGLAFRSPNPAQADQAVLDAKQLASDTLQDVRRSVGALRANPASIESVPNVSDSDERAGPVSRQPKSRIGVLLSPRPFDLVLSLVYIGTLVSVFVSGDTGSRLANFGGWGYALIASPFVALLVLDRLDHFFFGEAPPVRTAILLFGLRVLLLAAVASIAGTWYLLFLTPLLPYRVFLYFGIRWGYIVGTLCWLIAAGFGLFSLFGEDAYNRPTLTNVLTGIFFFSLMLLIVVTASRTVVMERTSRVRAEELLKELKAANGQLKVYSEQALAAVQERNHLAQEIHDSLGHYLTVVNVQLEKAIVFRGIAPEASDQAIRDAKCLSSEALQEVRGSIGVLRTTHELPSIVEALGQLLSNMSGGQLAVGLRIEGSEEGFSKQSLMVLYRAAQEGLTNAQKHSGAGHVSVELQFGEDEAVLNLSDDGCGFEPSDLQDLKAEREGRYGLVGLRERLETVGGRLELESKPGVGTRLCVAVPKDPLGWAMDDRSRR